MLKIAGNYYSKPIGIPNQDALLSGVAEATRRLLAITDFDAAVNGALEAIATAAGIDRIFIYQHHIDSRTQREFANCPYEWTMPGVIKSCDLPEQYPMFYDEITGYSDWLAELKAGRAVQKLAEEMSSAGQAKQNREQALSVLTVPIFIENDYWGNFGFDDCTTARVWSEAEIAVLETAAASLAGALQRRENLAELERRDALLKSVNAATQCLVANEDLSEVIPKALKILGEGTRQDRVYVFENIDEEGGREILWATPYEWVSPGIPTSMEIIDKSPLSMSVFPTHINDLLLDSKPVQFLARDLNGAALEVNKICQTKSLVAVPISVSGHWWGILGFDDCTTERVWSEAEIAVLETAAACIGSAIERDRSRKEKDAAAQARASELEAHNSVLEGRDRILQVTAAASTLLLNGEDFDTSVGTALQILGERVGFDRIAVGQQFDDPTGATSGYIKFLYEWYGPGISSQLNDHEDMAEFHWDDIGISSWYEANLKGEAFGQIIDELPEPFRTLMQSVDVESTHNVPIFVEGQFWGVFGIDHCRARRLLTEAELIALKTTANCVGSAIARDRSRKETEAAAQARAAELAERDRILEATAAAANVMLTDEDFEDAIQKALQIIGEAVGTDRVGIAQHLADLTETDLGHWRVAYEWFSPEMLPVAQLFDPEPMQGTYAGAEQLYEIHQQGKGFSITTAQMIEPFRSIMAFAGIQTLHSVPIILGDRYWGTVVFGDCRQQRQRSFAELAALQAVADCIGNAIERETLRQSAQQAREAREAAERTALIERERAARAAELEAANQFLSTRDRWLETTAIAANQLLSSDDVETSVNRALKTIGENLDCDRVWVLQSTTRPSAPEDDLGVGKLIYEWYTAEQEPHLDKPELSEVSGEHFQAVFEQLLLGQWVGGIVDELDEPLRSRQQSLGIQSFYTVPVFVEDKIWGVIGMDHCQAAKRLSLAELAVFRTAATCIGSAIYQAEVQRDRAAQERATELAKANTAIAKTLDTLATKPQLREFLGELLTAISQQIGARLVHLFLYDEVSHTLNLHTSVTDGQVYAGASSNEIELFHHPIPADITPAWKLISESPGILTDDQLRPLQEEMWWPGIHEWHQAQGHVSIACVPMNAGSQPLGFIGFAFCDLTILTKEQLGFMQALTNQAIVAVQLTCLAEEAKQNAILQAQEKAAQERAANLAKTNEAIAKSLTTLAASPELNEFLGTIVAEMAQQLNACKVHLFLYDASSHTLTQHIAVQDGQIYIAVGPNDPKMFSQPIPADITPGWQAIITSDRPLTYDETLPYDEEIWWPESVGWHKVQGHKAVTCIPMKAGDTPIGFIGFCFYDRTVLTDEQLEFMKALSNQAIVAIQLTRLAEEAQKAAVLQEQEKAAQERAVELAKTNEAIAQTLNALTTEPELDRFLGQILTCIMEQIGADDTHLFLYNDVSHTFRSHLAVQNGIVYPGNAPGDPELFYQAIPTDITPGWQMLINAPKPLTLDKQNPDAVEFYWPQTLKWHELRGHQSVTCACMKIGAQPIGFIGFAFCDRTVLTDEQLEFIQALTNQATLSIHLTRLADEANQIALINALTDERNRLAREIHDTLAQAFTGVSLQLEAVRILLQDPAILLSEKAINPQFHPDPNLAHHPRLREAEAHIRRARDLARKGLSEARRSVRALRSEALETDALPDALHKILAQTQRDTGLITHFHLEGTPIPLPDDIQLNLLRIAQEAITNTLRHADASQLDLTLSFCSPPPTQQVQLRIIDNGNGFEPAILKKNSGFGLIGIRERTTRFYGRFDLQSTPGVGTTLDIILPLALHSPSPPVLP